MTFLDDRLSEDRGSKPAVLRIGIDIGGTFTDFVVHDPGAGSLQSLKLPTTPENPAQVVLDGLTQIVPELNQPEEITVDIIHGSTVATNALIERKGARTALVATEGFRDVLQIGRQNRPELYNLTPQLPPPIVPDYLRFEAAERIDCRGVVQKPLEEVSLQKLLAEFDNKSIDAVAVCLLFSFLNPSHEQKIGKLLRDQGYFVSLSSEVLPEYREYERMSTTVVNAYVSPVLNRYLSHLEERFSELKAKINFRILQSNGGSINVQQARSNGVRSILSGPAGGVVGANAITLDATYIHFEENNDVSYSKPSTITFDMGGTSTDVSLVDEEPRITTEAAIAGFPIRIPVLDIHTIGAGGGSIAHVDAGGALRVGPQSAGSDPGPACYGKGDFPTVTDANLVLGRLAPEHFLGGRLPLIEKKSVEVLSQIGEQISLDLFQTALGVVEIVNAHMERALRVISVERGYDPKYCRMLSFGGSGGLHAVELARRTGIPVVVVPPLASTLSAYGMLAADVIKDYVQTVMLETRGNQPPLDDLFAPLVQQGLREMAGEGVQANCIEIEKSLDVRYKGQSFELRVPYSPEFIQVFHKRHYRIYGYSQPEEPVEIVNIRVRGVGEIPIPRLSEIPMGDLDPSRAFIETKSVIYSPERSASAKKSKEFQSISTPFYLWDRLLAGDRISGPAVVVRSDTTVLLSRGDNAVVDRYANLVVEVGQS
jgi:N-methylhydantoinase A